MLKKFFNNESKATIRDFLFWLLVYPFVIAFAVACVAFIFSFSEFKGAKITDWISSLSTLLGVCIAWVAANSWKQQKMPDFKKKLLDDLLSFEKLFFVYLYNLEKLKNNRNLFEIESISSLAVLEIDFESAKFFDYTLSTKLLEKLEEMSKTLNKIFSQEEHLSIDDKELNSILRELISIGTKCEEIILDKDGSS